MAKRTEGPWEAVLNDDPRGQPVPYYRGLICTVEYGNRHLAVVAKSGVVSSAEWEANTHLIAAAPQMRDALERLLTWIDRTAEPGWDHYLNGDDGRTDGGDGWGDLGALSVEVRAALAAADTRAEP